MLMMPALTPQPGASTRTPAEYPVAHRHPFATHMQEYDHSLHVAEVSLKCLCSSEDAGLGSHTYLKPIQAMLLAVQVAELMAEVSQACRSM
jgi:hypothetical protein